MLQGGVIHFDQGAADAEFGPEACRHAAAVAAVAQGIELLLALHEGMEQVPSVAFIQQGMGLLPGDRLVLPGAVLGENLRPYAYDQL
jgi:hypothetical protein|tara:strand:+ start:121 stop:381 length:261 start_codon:yes stop_codon:yes gene_type:complete